jgi:hypothetical protein
MEGAICQILKSVGSYLRQAQTCIMYIQIANEGWPGARKVVAKEGMEFAWKLQGRR